MEVRNSGGGPGRKEQGLGQGVRRCQGLEAIAENRRAGRGCYAAVTLGQQIFGVQEVEGYWGLSNNPFTGVT